MLTNETACLEEVAAAIGKRPSWLKRHWRRFHEQTGFPRKIPAGDVWPRRAVEAWLRTGGQFDARPMADNQNDGAADMVSAAAASLLARYGAKQ